MSGPWGFCTAIVGHAQQRSEWLDARGGEKEEVERERNVQRERRTVRHDRQEKGKGNAEGGAQRSNGEWNGGCRGEPATETSANDVARRRTGLGDGVGSQERNAPGQPKNGGGGGKIET